MRRQRGFGLIELAIYAAIAVAVLGAIAGVVHVWNNYTDGLDKKGYERGVDETTAKYAKRDNQALRDAITAHEKAEARVAVLEAEAAGKITAADAAYQEGLKNGKADVDAAVGRVHAGYRLRDSGGSATGPSIRLGPAKGASTGDPGKRDGEARADVPEATGCNLSERASRALYILAGEADDVAKQLTACQVELKVMYEFALKLSYALSGGDPPR